MVIIPRWVFIIIFCSLLTAYCLVSIVGHVLTISTGYIIVWALIGLIFCSISFLMIRLCYFMLSWEPIPKGAFDLIASYGGYHGDDDSEDEHTMSTPVKVAIFCGFIVLMVILADFVIPLFFYRFLTFAFLPVINFISHFLGLAFLGTGGIILGDIAAVISIYEFVGKRIKKRDQR